MSANVPGEISADGQHYWNGQQWVTTLSPDGAHRWNGTAWIPVSPPSGPPGNPAPAWLSMDPPAAPSPAPSGPAVPVPAYAPAVAAASNRAGLGWQFGGSAAWSIGWGLLAIVVPLASPQHTYFVILPLFGLWRAFSAFRVGRTAGAVVGFALNAVAGLISLYESGLLGSLS
jgi:hypothetical protein